MCDPNSNSTATNFFSSSSPSSVSPTEKLPQQQPQPPLQPHVYVTLITAAAATATAKKVKEGKVGGGGGEEEEKARSAFPFDIPSLADAVRESRALLALSSPIAATALLLYSRSIVSMLFLGLLGPLPLAAGSLAVAFANITAYSVLSGLSLGMEPLCSQSHGANHPDLLSLTLHRSVLFLLLSSLPISFLWLHLHPLLSSLGHQDPALLSLARTFLLFSLPDLLTFSVLHPVRIFLRSQGLTAPLTAASAAAAAAHIPANLLLRHLGLPGVALASSLTNLLLLAALLAYIVTLPTWRRPTRECLTGWGPLLRLAGPSAASVCLEWWWYELLVLLCGFLPSPNTAVASMGVLIQTTALLYVFPSSLSFGVSTRVGNELGANRPARARVAASIGFLASVAMGVVAMAFAVGVSGRWASIFTGDADIRRLTAAALPIVGLCELGNCPQTVACGVLRGSARPSAAANVNLGAFYLVGMPVAVGLGFGVGLGFRGLWMGLFAAQVCCAGLMLFVVGSTDWELQAHRAQLLTRGGELTVKVEDVCREPLISIKIGEVEKMMISTKAAAAGPPS